MKEISVLLLFVAYTIIHTGLKPMFDTRMFENLKLHVYKDSEGYLTIGWGHSLTTGNNQNLVKLGLSPSQLLQGKRDLTREEADALYELDKKDADNQIRKLVPNFDTQPVEIQDILRDLCFNMGPGRLAKFKNTLPKFIKQDYKAAARGLMASDWFKQTRSRAHKIVYTLDPSLKPYLNPKWIQDSFFNTKWK